MFDIFLYLSILTNYRAKILEWIPLWYLLSFNSHGSLKLQSIYSVFVWLLLKTLDSKASLSLSIFCIHTISWFFHQPYIICKQHTQGTFSWIWTVNLSIINVKRQGLKVNPWCKPMVVGKSPISPQGVVILVTAPL